MFSFQIVNIYILAQNLSLVAAGMRWKVNNNLQKIG